MQREKNLLHQTHAEFVVGPALRSRSGVRNTAGFTRHGVREMKSIIDGLGDDAKATIFAAARIR